MDPRSLILKRGKENNRKKKRNFLASCFSFYFKWKTWLISCLYIAKKRKKERKNCCSLITLDPASSCNFEISHSGLFYHISPIVILFTVSYHTGTEIASLCVLLHSAAPNTDYSGLQGCISATWTALSLRACPCPKLCSFVVMYHCV